MKRFIEGDNRQQITLLPESLDEYIEEENPVRAVDLFVDQLDLGGLGFSVAPAATGRPSYHPSTLLKLYVYGYLNRIQSSRRLEREAQRNVELMWLLGRLSPDFKTIADFRRDNGEGIRNACRQFVVLCRQLNLFAQAVVAIDVLYAGLLFDDLLSYLRQEIRLSEIDLKQSAIARFAIAIATLNLYQIDEQTQIAKPKPSEKKSIAVSSQLSKTVEARGGQLLSRNFFQP